MSRKSSINTIRCGTGSGGVQSDGARQLTERYNRDACAYRDLWAPVLRIAGRRLLSEFRASAVQRVIDVGAGVGALAEDIRAAFPGAFVAGIDRSAGMLRLAPDWMPRVAADALQLPVASGTVDLVLLLFVLFHLEPPLAALQEARRVLRRGGKVGTLTWSGEFESRASRIWTECLDEFGAAPVEMPVQTCHSAVDTPEKIENLLRDAGFSDIHAWRGEIERLITAEHLLSLRTRLGSCRPRFDSLDVAAQQACIADARRRMQALSPADFVARGSVVYAVAGQI
ncbi:MAG: methyltransferase domain-containing protein [Acidobacteria bacterium]|nr:methyltransferase domain-containing protein [Acidobacteriota bacterium]